MNAGKVLRIAGREFASTVLTKGFIIGALVVPAVIAAILPIVIILVNSAKPPADIGEVALIDRSGVVGSAITEMLDPQQIIVNRREQLESMKKVASELLGLDIEALTQEQLGSMSDEQMGSFLEQFGVPQLRVTELEPGSDVEAQQALLRENISKPGTNEDRGLLALAIVDEDAVVKPDDADHYGAFSVFTVPKLDDRTVDEIRGALRRAILEKRYEAAGMDSATINALTSVNAKRTQEVTETGTRESAFELQMLIPAGFMILMLMGVMTGGQYLLTTTIEEKSSRVVELLLSAVSSIELMTGKIVGQMAVGLTLLLIYNAVGIVALVVFKHQDLINGSTIAWMLLFFALAYFMFAAIMAAIGAAVNELREAQAMMTPVMLFLMIPYFFFLPVTRDPGSVMATTLSFIPPISPYIIIMRIASNTPPPMWQILLAVAVNVVGVVVFVWLAAKVFRVGLLMFGKPPNIRTLIKWVRMA